MDIVLFAFPSLTTMDFIMENHKKSTAAWQKLQVTVLSFHITLKFSVAMFAGHCLCLCLMDCAVGMLRRCVNRIKL